MYVHGCNIRDNIEVVKKERLQDICIKKRKSEMQMQNQIKVTKVKQVVVC
jgi:hypothetical protein